MKYYVNIQGKEFEIELKEDSQGLVGLLNGKTYHIDHAEIERGAKYSVIIDGESFNVSMQRTPYGEDFIVGGHLYQAEVFDEREKGAQALEEARGLKGPQVVKSVMPGIVRKVFVEPGDEVAAGAPLLILEAMKMENELCAEKEGKVSKVHVAEGQTVNSSDPLVAID
ncbi:MAG: acyl-CoA carboxylase biotin carboxyl carrier protein subunit [Planctomycetota bacterium]|jgi:biotin carboxyl carrier protein